jgi:paraquat-inducible protein B
MSRKANPTLVGTFVVSAVVLAVAAILLLSGGRYFHDTRPFVLNFEGDVNGLSVGSPVKFQGVKVGSVTHIRLRITPEGATTTIPVHIKLDQSLIGSKSGTSVSLSGDSLKRAIDQGLRARLEVESLLTGQRYVALQLLPDTPANLRNFTDDGELEEIPTLPATSEELRRVLEQFKNVDIPGLVGDLKDTARAVSELVDSQAMKALPESLQRTLGKIDLLVDALRAEVEPLSARVGDVSASISRVADAADTTLQTLRPTLESLRATSDRAQELEGDAARTLAAARDLLSADSPLVIRLQTSLDEFSATARALRAVAEMIERDPSALLRGKDRKP